MVDEAQHSSPPSAPTTIARVEHATISREAGIWTIEFDRVVRHVPDLKGLEYLSRLLRQPGEPIPSTSLDRRTGAGDGAAERARLNVTRAIRSVLARLDLLHPSLAAHLRATVRTGNECCYRPDPRVPIRWS